MNFPSYPGDIICTHEIKKKKSFGLTAHMSKSTLMVLPDLLWHQEVLLVQCRLSHPAKTQPFTPFLTRKKFFLASNETLTGEPGCPSYPGPPEAPCKIERNVSQGETTPLLSCR